MSCFIANRSGIESQTFAPSNSVSDLGGWASAWFCRRAEVTEGCSSGSPPISTSLLSRRIELKYSARPSSNHPWAGG